MLKNSDKEMFLMWIFSCLIDENDSINIINQTEPKFKTRRDRFISSVVSRGPNNQLISLRETIFIAIKLDRALILPPFFKHDLGDPSANGSGMN